MLTRQYLNDNTVKYFTDKMLNIALEADGTNIFVFGEYTNDLTIKYLEEDSYLMSILKSKDKKYKGIKVNKSDKRIRFKNKSSIYFMANRTELQAHSITGAEIHTAFIHNASTLPLYNIQYVMCRMRFGPWKPPEERVYSKESPYFYLDMEREEITEFMDKHKLKDYEVYQEK